MEQNVIRKNMWNTAAKAGLILGLVSTSYMFITKWTGQAEIPAFLNLLLNGALWCAKFCSCIWLMMFFMRRFAAENPDVRNVDTRRLGIITALLSALVFSAFSLADIMFISPEFYTEQINASIQEMIPMMDSNTLSMIDKYLEMLPQITFFSTLIYCFIFGAVLSAILSRNIPSKDPFADYKPQK